MTLGVANKQDDLIDTRIANRKARKTPATQTR